VIEVKTIPDLGIHHHLCLLEQFPAFWEASQKTFLEIQGFGGILLYRDTQNTLQPLKGQLMLSNDIIYNKFSLCSVALLCPRLNQLNRLRDGTHLLFQQSVEFIKASPRTTAHQAHKNPPHGLKVNTLVTVENQDLST